MDQSTQTIPASSTHSKPNPDSEYWMMEIPYSHPVKNHGDWPIICLDSDCAECFGPIGPIE